jgi:putative ABC transport system permease protein
MTFNRLLSQTVRFHWRTSLAVLFGVIVATAVICGAMIVGDSVRESLRLMALARLGRIDHVLESPRFFREELATELGNRPEFQESNSDIAPVISLVSSVQRAQESETGSPSVVRAGKVNLFGVDERFWELTDHDKFEVPVESEIVLSDRLARQLRATAGDEVSIWLEIPSSLPRESLLGKRDASVIQISVKVKSVLPESLGLGRLGLRPNQQLPLNAFLPLKTMQEALGVARSRPTAQDRSGLPARVNSLYVASRNEAGRSPAAAQELTRQLASVLQLSDLDLRLVDQPQQGYFALESTRMILDDYVSESALKLAKSVGGAKFPSSESYIYLANELSTTHNDKTFSMYSVIAGMDFQENPPFGPYQFIGPVPAHHPLAKDEIVINEWLAKDLQAKLGDTIRVKYHVIGSHGELPEESQEFKLVGILKFEGTIAEDRGLTPEVKGITNVKTLDKWDAPFKMDYARITDRDHAYWNQYKATPKAFVSLERAQDLWRSRYGKLTSIRMARDKDANWGDLESLASSHLIHNLDLERMGMAFAPVKALGLQAAAGTTDFGGLFIGFSLFLIVSAAALVRLLFKLGIERRASEIGLLQALGFSPRQVARLLFCEGLLIVVVGAILGMVAGVGYASLMVYGLKTWWVKAIGTKFLVVSVQPLSLVIGFVIAFVVAGLAVWRAFGQLRTVSVRGLMAGQIVPAAPSGADKRRSVRTGRTAVACAVITLLLSGGSILGLVPDTPGLGPLSWRTVAFFLGGMSCLVAGLSALSWWLDRDSGIAVRGRGFAGLSRLGLRNASRNRSRSVTTVWLIASATFLIVAVAAGQRNPARELPEKFSGNGGFTLVAESSRPILFDLNSEEGRKKLNLNGPEFDAIWNAAGSPTIYPFRVKPGDEASCLNLYQSQLPTVLGAPRELMERGGFRFVGATQSNPWTLLTEPAADGSVPVFGDMNTLMYSLHKGVGVKLGVPNDQDPQHQLRIAGMFDGAVFQGVLVAAESRFLEVFPEQVGAQYFLIEVPPEHADKVSELLETRLEAYGFDAERVSDRLADFLSVQNTYLSTFQTLGGLGLLLGTLGLAAVMLRNVIERRGEIALLRSVGFSAKQVAILILCETTVLLLWGLVVGTLSALLSMLPHLVSIGADVPWSSAGLMLTSVFVFGTLAALIAVRAALKLPVLATLRAEA